MNSDEEYLEKNRLWWNKRTASHLGSDFYDVKGFLEGRNSLNSIELDLLGNISGKSVLHLQCHFGQDSLSLARMGAMVTGIDLSDSSIEAARKLADRAGIKARFINCDVYNTRQETNEYFDTVFTSYGTVGWLPDLGKWAEVISSSLKTGGEFVMADFHPVVWMFDNDFKEIKYRYFKGTAIIETEQGSYADRNSGIGLQSIGWNHGMAEVISSLLDHDLVITCFREFDYSPYNCFSHTIQSAPGRFRIEGLGDKIPMVYALKAVKK